MVQLAPGSVDKPNAKVITSNPGPNTQADKGSTVTLITIEGGGGGLFGGRGD